MKEREKPEFKRREAHRRKRLRKKSWRYPKGRHGRPKFLKKHMPPMPSMGYRQPKIVRGLHPSGYEEVLIRSIGELEGVDPKKQAIRLACALSRQKKEEIAKLASEKGIKVLNPPK